MGVYIKDMEMPVIELEWTIRRGADGKWYAIDTNAETSDGEWHEIVPVPPHGRLIDADAFIKQKTELICENCNRRRGMKDGKLTKRFVYAIGDAPCRACDTGDMLDYVDDAPIIIPAEEGE